MDIFSGNVIGSRFASARLSDKLGRAMNDMYVGRDTSVSHCYMLSLVQPLFCGAENILSNFSALCLA
jgi:hypothetical protein